jgi:hypothetical protein
MALVQPLIASSSGGGVFIFIIVIAIAVLEIVGLWKVYTKANEPGWAAIIPFYNYWVLLRIVGRPGWWIVLYFIPIVNFFVALIVLWDLAKSFNKTGGFFLGMLFLGFIFFPILGFGSAQYAGAAGPDKWVTKTA